MALNTATISLRQARALALDSQGLSGPQMALSPRQLLDVLGAVQIDTISVLARSHVLVNWARLGALSVRTIESSLWSKDDPSTFEYWSHAACVIPIDRWSWYAFKRRERRARGKRWHRLENGEQSLAAVRARLTNDGPLTANELGGAKGSGPWWDWTENKIAVEWLLDLGEVACVNRRGFQRVYDLSERVIPAHYLAEDFDDQTCHRLLIAAAGRALGIATVDELAAYNGLSTKQVRAQLPDSGLVEVDLERSTKPNYADVKALEKLDQPSRSRTTLLSPFDSLCWYRPRTERLFGFVHRLEAYVPRDQRVHGYFAMPILSGERLVGRVDPKRRGTTFVGAHVSLESAGAVRPAVIAMRKAARWIGADSVVVERVHPAELGPDLHNALRRS